MKVFSSIVVLATVAASALASTIELGYPTSGTILYPGETLQVQVVQPVSMASCYQVGIALAIANCQWGAACPDPAKELGSVLYAGPWTPESHQPGGNYQNITVTLPENLGLGPAIFSLTHLCLLGGGPYPFLEFRNASVLITS